MSEAKKLLNKMMEGFPDRLGNIKNWGHIEDCLQPVFDLLAQIHKLAHQGMQFEEKDWRDYQIHKTIEELTRKYDKETK